MPNTPNPKHPALLQQFRSQATTIDSDNIAQLEQWEFITPEWKRLLSVMPWFNSMHLACDYLQLKYDTMRHQMRAHPYLREMLEWRKDSIVDIVRSIGIDQLGIAAVKLQEMLDDKTLPAATKLKVIETVFKMNKIGEDNTQGSYIQANTIINFPGSEAPAQPPWSTVDATG